MLTWMFTFNTYIHMSELYTGNKCTPYTHQIDHPCLPVLWNNIYSNASFHLHVLSPNFTLLRENLHNYSFCFYWMLIVYFNDCSLYACPLTSPFEHSTCVFLNNFIGGKLRLIQPLSPPYPIHHIYRVTNSLIQSIEI